MTNVKGPIHGRYSTYTNWQCRCEKCRAANAAYQRAKYAQRRRTLSKLGYNVTPKKKRVRPEYGVSDLSRALTVRRLLPKQSAL